MPTSWIDAEPDFFAMRHEISRLRQRAARRRRHVLIGAALVSAATVVAVLRAPHDYVAQISVRVTEVVDFNLPRSTWTDRELRSFVTEVAFTNEVLTRVYRTHIEPVRPAPNLIRGVESLREDIEVEAARNRAALPISGQQSGPRSAYVILRYAFPREDVALAVVTALAKPIMESSAQRRRLESEQDISRARLALEDARAMVAKLRAQALETAGTPMPGVGRESPVKLTALHSALNDAHIRVARFQQDLDAAQRRHAAEKQRPGIDFDIAMQGVDKPFPLGPLLIAVALLTFLIALPIVALLIGAASATIDTLDDIRRLGLPVLGRLPGLGPGRP